MNPHLFLDTNVLLDFFLAREPHAQACAQILDQVAKGQWKASISSVTLTNVAYILGRLEKRRIIEKDILQLLEILQVVPDTGAMFAEAAEAPMQDFEDAVQYVSAIHAECTHFVTSNKRDFRRSRLPVQDPSELLRSLRSTSSSR